MKKIKWECPHGLDGQQSAATLCARLQGDRAYISVSTNKGQGARGIVVWKNSFIVGTGLGNRLRDPSLAHGDK